MAKIPKHYQIAAAVILSLLILAYILGKTSGDDPDKISDKKGRAARNAVEDEARKRGIHIDPAEVQRHARGLQTAFGWGTGLFGSDAMTEDEDAIAAIVLLYDFDSYVLLEVAYFELTNRNLTADIYAKVDTGNINRLRDIFPL